MNADEEHRSKLEHKSFQAFQDSFICVNPVHLRFKTPLPTYWRECFRIFRQPLSLSAKSRCFDPRIRSWGFIFQRRVAEVAEGTQSLACGKLGKLGSRWNCLVHQMGDMELPWKNALQYPKTQTLLSVPSATSAPLR